MQKTTIDRRNFTKLLTGSIAGLGTASLLNPFKATADHDLTPSKHADNIPMADPQVSIDDLEITGFKLIRLKFPGKTPRRWNAIIESGGGAPSMNYIEVYTKQGIIGRSKTKGPSSVYKTILEKVKGENPFFIERIWDRMYRYQRKPVAKGDYIKCMGGVDIALWDIVGKALNLPVYKVLGGFNKKIYVYAAGGYYEEGKTTLDLVQEMEGYISEGFRAVKMKIGGASFNTDVERVRAVREALGPDIDLLIDANNKWHAYEAIRFGRAVEKYNPYWFEEPVEPDDFVGCAEVRQALDIPIVAGENEFTRWGCRDLIQAGSADILNLDTIKAGGITEYRKIAALASAYHIPVAPHGDPHMAIHLHASTPNSLIMETYPGVSSRYNPVLPLFPVVNGYVTIPETPGIGLEFDPELVKKYKVD